MEILNTFILRLKDLFFKVLLPENHFSPDGADTFDIRVVGNLSPNSTEILLEYTAQDSQTIRFIRYGLYTNIVPAVNVDFFPTKNGSRILRYHGDCNDDFKLNLSVGPDLSENSLIPCDIVLMPGQTVRWTVKNNGDVPSDVGVRMRGYLITANNTGNRAFGG
jgi:hypothetical protein